MTFGFGGVHAEFDQARPGSQALALVRDAHEGSSSPVAAVQPVSPLTFGTRSANSELLTVREVAALLRLSRATIYRMVDRGELPAFRVAGAFLRFRGSDILTLIERAHL